MATKKESSLIQYEIEFIESKLAELKKYIEDRPFDKIVDRTRMQQTLKGGYIEVLSASVEVQRKDITSAIKEYAELTIVVEKMRQQREESEKAVAKGNANIPARMQKKTEDGN